MILPQSGVVDVACEVSSPHLHDYLVWVVSSTDALTVSSLIVAPHNGQAIDWPYYKLQIIWECPLCKTISTIADNNLNFTLLYFLA